VVIVTVDTIVYCNQVLILFYGRVQYPVYSGQRISESRNLYVCIYIAACFVHIVFHVPVGRVSTFVLNAGGFMLDRCYAPGGGNLHIL
jgi:hypothetical protein